MKEDTAATGPEPRLLTGREAARYFGGERPERFGVNPTQGNRQRLYDRRAIDAALDRIAGLGQSPEDPIEALAREWR